MKKILTFFFLLFSLFLTSCDDGLDSYSTKQGVFEAYFMPKDTFMFVQFLDSQNDQKDKFAEIMKRLPVSNGDFFGNLTATLLAYGVDYNTEIAPLLGDSRRISIGINPPKNPEQQGDMIISFVVDDFQKASDWMNSLTQKEGFFKDSIANYDIVGNTTTNFYLALYKDVILMANSRDALKEAFDALADTKSSLISSDIFKEKFKNFYDDRFLFVYLDSSASAANMNLDQITKIENLNIGVREFLYLTATKDGVKINAFVQSDKEDKKLSKNKVKIPKLAEYIANANLIGYAESPNITKTLQLELDDSSESFKQLEETIKRYFAMDLKKDILTFFDKSVAFSMHAQQDNPFPAIGILVDASSNPEGASQFVTKIDDQIDGVIALINFQFADYSSTISKDTVDIEGKSLTRIVLDFSKLPSQVFTAFAQIPDFVKNNKVSLTYGMLKDDILFVSTADKFEFDQSLANSDLFQDMNSDISDFQDGRLYIELPNIIGLTDQIKILNEKLNGPMTEQQNLSYELFKQYANAFESMIFGTKVLSSSELEVDGFVKVKDK